MESKANQKSPAKAQKGASSPPKQTTTQQSPQQVVPAREGLRPRLHDPARVVMSGLGGTGFPLCEIVKPGELTGTDEKSDDAPYDPNQDAQGQDPRPLKKQRKSPAKKTPEAPVLA